MYYKMAKFIYGIGIQGVGEYISRQLVENFNSIEDLILAEHSDIIKIDGISNKIAKNIINYFNCVENLKLIIKFKQLGVISAFEDFDFNVRVKDGYCDIEILSSKKHLNSNCFALKVIDEKEFNKGEKQCIITEK